MTQHEPPDQDVEAPDVAAPGVAPSLDLLVDEHEEEVSENGRTVRRQGIYLLPNLFTTGALFAGFYAVIAAMRGDFESAAIAIFAAGVLDGLDGRIARLTHTTSKFGAEYDSLADMVSFGVAPALVMFSWALGDLGKFGWSAAFIYVACAALRLARFNTRIDTADKNYFTGLASPAAAAIIASTVWVCHDQGWVGAALPVEVSVLVGVLTAAVGFLMIANFPYYSFKGVDFRGRVPFVVIVLVVIVFGLVTLDPPLVFLLAFLAYACSGPVMQVRNWRQRRTSGH
ncbi:CDP-diacylglycerol--serine O-phosphatidyltransferase [Parahaliea aestuarii]|uniref:CDP-diacylglycerol--serine O-phosphatidyltransferase n=1 Tax=Parahaliea aestuarii TaxID=1852021 RepID=A0A5C8ZQ45_9GAMM|nr:CDP-diacylglycerol--serine O-phosphatidyltransferase [Parahaliea aestuarii]TXS89924.1 CDP-diacylglycerol--serine O-phosphatidyltransferase [Parahaliea aestuarii]